MDIKIKKDEWDQLDAATKRQISDVIAGSFRGSRIVPDPAGASLASARTAATARGSPIGEVVCTFVETAAKAACAGLGNPVAVAACIAVAEAAGKACRDSV